MKKYYLFAAGDDHYTLNFCYDCGQTCRGLTPNEANDPKVALIKGKDQPIGVSEGFEDTPLVQERGPEIMDTYRLTCERCGTCLHDAELETNIF